MANVAELQCLIDRAVKEVDRNYRNSLKKVKKLKEKINETEQTISLNELSEKRSYVDKLNHAIERLHKLSDSATTDSERAWEKYKILENYCQRDGIEPAMLDDIKLLCKKTEELASDLLCYSLARLGQKEKIT